MPTLADYPGVQPVSEVFEACEYVDDVELEHVGKRASLRLTAGDAMGRITLRAHVADEHPELAHSTDLRRDGVVVWVAEDAIDRMEQ